MNRFKNVTITITITDIYTKFSAHAPPRHYPSKEDLSVDALASPVYSKMRRCR